VRNKSLIFSNTLAMICPKLTERVHCLRNDIINLEDKKRDAMNQLIIWNAQLYDLGKEIDIKNQQRKRMGN
jgi:hypothetical protein